MLTINGNEIVFQTTLILRPAELALISTPDVCGFDFALNVGENGVMPHSPDELKKTLIDNKVSFDIPFLPNKYVMSYDNTVTYGGKTVHVLIAAHGVSNWMILHLECRSLKTYG